MSGGIEKTRTLTEFELPWNKHAGIQEISYEGGMTMLRIRIREGRRFTDIELMPKDAQVLAKALEDWATEQN